MTIALSHGGPTVYTSTARSKILLVGTTEGVVWLQRDDAGWSVRERFLPGLHICALMVDQVGGTLFAGAHGDGSLHASVDGGRTWRRRDTGIGQTNIYSLETTRIDGRVRIFCGTEPAHLYYSDDMGHQWTELEAMRGVPSVSQWSFPAPPHVAHTKHITFDPRDSRTMYVGIEVGGLLKTADAGRTWTELHGMYEDVHRLAINPKDPRMMYVSGGDGIYVSQDGGESWEHWTTRDHAIGGYPDQLVIHPQQPQTLFVASSEDGPGSWMETHFAGSRISRSDDGGRTWRQLANGLPDRMQSAVEAMCLEDWGGGFSVFAATTAGEIYGSEDGGETWGKIVDDVAPVSKGGHHLQLAGGVHA